ncbi:MAG: 3D domain-containing protein [Acidobacteria bacterium]|nr:3D domain-containing protein [Acidobacteriota bacterium]
MKRQGKSLSYYLASVAGFAIGFAGIVSPFAYFKVVKANDVVFEKVHKLTFSANSNVMSAMVKLPAKGVTPSINQNDVDALLDRKKLTPNTSQNNQANAVFMPIEIVNLSKLDVIDSSGVLPKPGVKLELKELSKEPQNLQEESPKDVTKFANRLRDGKKVKMVATAYCLNGRTASGVFSKYGIIAADPKYLPIGSIVRIRGGEYTGLYSVLDTGTKIKGRKIDIYLTSGKEAIEFGRRDVTLEVLRYGWNPQIYNDEVLEEKKNLNASIR